ncbi:glutathione hydrolase 1 proenzyme-like [Porites lutea]|uniref:glutathione hydrolase 1 proenzyme-like n=1 Tax=Porites lutea TaxID=51062 RepID=UPI003CC5580A
MELGEAENQKALNKLSSDEQPVDIEFDKGSRFSTRCKIITVIVAVVVAIIILCVVLILVLAKDKEAKPTTVTPTPTEYVPPPLPTGVPAGADGPYDHGVVAADASLCSEVGRDILKKNGSAVDSAIATLFCIGVINMHSAGIGGGGFMTIYNRSTNKAEVIDYREEAPGRANATMYINSTLNSKYGTSASGVPGEVRGFRKAWNKYGRLPWEDLVQPAIDLAKKGFRFGYPAHAAANRSSTLPYIKKDPGLSELLIDKAGNLKKLGTVLKMPKYARTLETIRDEPDSFYSGELAKSIVKDIQDGGGIITLEDMKNYTAKVRTPLSDTMGDLKWYTNPPPGSGAVLSMILNILKGYNFTQDSRKDLNSSILTYHRIIEAFKFAYAYRALLGDEDYWDVSEVVKNMTSGKYGDYLRHKIYDNRTFQDYRYYGDFYSSTNVGGTSHLSIISPDGDAVAATNTINLYYGCKYRSTRTGIIYNNEMDDFSTPGKKNNFGVEPSESNFIKAGKRPMSSMTPSIFVDSRGVPRLAVGASGGTRITTAISLVVMNYFWFGRNLSEAILDPRVHHQLLPDYIRIDKFYPISKDLQAGLRRLGHNDIQAKTITAVVQAAAIAPDGKIYGKADPRKKSFAAGF